MKEVSNYLKITFVFKYRLILIFFFFFFFFKRLNKQFLFREDFNFILKKF